jgi:beta-galactosidase
MQECGVNVVRIGEFAWALMEPEQGKYDFSLFDRAIAVLAAHGIKVIFGTPTAAPPKWLTHRYPDTLLVYADRHVADDQSRRHVCYNSPVYRDLSGNIVRALAEHFQHNPNIVGWQIDNEINCEVSVCYSNSCQAAFRKWLAAKYRTLGSLNQRWGNRFWSQWYTAWEQVDLPFPTPAWHNPALMLDYKRFISDSATSFVQEQTEILRKYRPADFITSNGVFKNINYYDFTRGMDIYAIDNYPCFLDEPQYPTAAGLTAVRGFMGRMMVMEQQTGPAGQTYMLRSPRPGEMNLWAFQAVAHGAEGILHFRWRGAHRGAEEYWFGVLDQDDIPRWRYEEFQKEGREIQGIGREILGSTVDSDIAVIKDYDDEWVYDHQYFTREVNVGAGFVNLFQAASELKYNIDFISPAADFSRYKLVFGPNLILIDPPLAKKIRDFVEGGGTFIISGHSGIKDRDNAMTGQTTPIQLSDLFGAEVDYFNCYQPPSAGKNAVKFSDGVAAVNVWADVLKPKGAKVIGTWDRDYLKGTPACTENDVAGGKAVYYGTFFNLDSARVLLRRFAAEQNLKPLLTGIPPKVEVTRRTKGNTNYYFILNHSDESVAVSPGPGFYDMVHGKPSPPSFTLKAFEYKVMRN